jgi:hypothetical protein
MEDNVGADKVLIGMKIMSKPFISVVKFICLYYSSIILLCGDVRLQEEANAHLSQVSLHHLMLYCNLQDSKPAFKVGVLRNM